MANELQSSGNSLSNTWLNWSSSVHNSLLSSKITLTSYIATNKEIFKISSVLELNNNIDQKNHYEIKEELIWKKSFKNLSGEEGQKLKDNRSSQSEGAFGIIKSNNGKIRFRRRGMNLVTLEMTLVCIGFNLMKYHNKKNRH